MQPGPRLFKIGQSSSRHTLAADAVILVAIALLIYLGARLAAGAARSTPGPTISLEPGMLPWYTALSLGRMGLAYLLSLGFSLAYGAVAARSRRSEIILLPLLDILQSVPILSFLPVVLLSLSAILPQALAVELASVVLIFTSQAWNLTFAWYQSLTTIPKELEEAGAVFRFNSWMRLSALQLPFAAVSLIWNSMMSWAGGWFFLMAAEIFTVGRHDFRLPGLGSYLQAAVAAGDKRAVGMGLAALLATIVALDQLVWQPLLAWAERFKLSMVEGEEASSWFYDILAFSRIAAWLRRRVFSPLGDRLDRSLGRLFPQAPGFEKPAGAAAGPLARALGLLCAAGLAYGLFRMGTMLSQLSLADWSDIGLGLGATFLRVAAALLLALAWTVPLGVAIGANPRVAAVLQPAVQIAASIPATAIFPVVLAFLVNLAFGLNLAAILLMLMGTQWYLLFNVIAGASTIPQDLKDTARLLGLSRASRWRVLILPSLFPYIITGAITAGGGAWNASIVSEYVSFSGQTVHTVGIGAIISEATAAGNYPLLLAATVSMVLTVVAFNRLVWRRLYRVAEERFRME